MSDNLHYRLKRMVVDTLKLDDVAPENIPDDEPLFASSRFGLDSIDALELVVAIEKEFGVKIASSEESREAGPVHVGYQFWRRLGIDAILEQAGLSERARQLSCAMTLNRLIHPASELAMPEWLRSTALPDILGVDFQGLAEDALYRNLDKLHPRREAIEAALANPKARRGYSRDHRGDCKQVLVGLAVNRDGFPLAHEVMAGNRHHSTTLEEMLAALDQRVGLREGQTVVAAPYSERQDWVEEFQDAAEFEEVRREPSPRNPFQKKPTIQVKLRQAGGETHVLCVSSERKEKDRLGDGA